ncbi:MAG: DoxX family protein [Pirellulales bacterium]
MEQMAHVAQGLTSLLARLMIVMVFLASTLGSKVPRFTETVAMMQSQGVPNPRPMLFGAIGLILIGSLSLITGAWTRMGAAFLAVFLAAATFYFHDFWTFSNPIDREAQVIHFLKNLAICGGLFGLIAFGGGPWSVDGWIDARREEAESSSVQTGRSSSTGRGNQQKRAA